VSQSREGKVLDGRDRAGSNAGRTGDADAERGIVVLFVLFVLLLGYVDVVDVAGCDAIGGGLSKEGLGRAGRDCVGEDTVNGEGRVFNVGNCVDRVFAGIV
jgi:hypothetical protein